MDKIFRVLLVMGLLLISLSAIFPSQGVQAADSPIVEQLQSGETRTNPYTKVIRIGGSTSSGTYAAVISSLPTTMPDLRTLITTNWILETGDDGVRYYTTGTNLVTARVTGTRITAQYEGKQAAWDPRITIGGIRLTLKSGPIVIDDPFNENYKGNTIQWEYAGTFGWWIFSREYTVTRYVRQIEGLLQEFYKLPYDPKGDLVINSEYDEESGYVWDRPVEAWDSGSRIVNVKGDSKIKTVSASELARSDIRYPVYIDPTTTFTTSSSDGHVVKTYGYPYSSIWGATSGDWAAATMDISGAGQSIEDGDFCILKGFVFFNTASLPEGIGIDSTVLKLYGSTDGSVTNFYITIQNGQPTYPHDPLVVGDFNKDYYSGDGGSLSTSSFTTTGYNSINLNTVGKGWISTTGWTKLAIRSLEDINGSEPTTNEFVEWYSYEKGTGYAPQLVVTYTQSIVKPTIRTDSATSIGETTATLRGTLTSDGGAACTLSFWYGLNPASMVLKTLKEEAGHVTGDSFTDTAVDLVPGTYYYYTIKAINSAGSSDNDAEMFLTKPSKPTSFVVTPGDTKNDLTWSLGVGAAKTMVRFSTTGYPSTPTSGTQAYFDTSNSYSHTGRTNGVTYYYSAWGERDGSYSPNYATGSGVPYVLGPPVVTTYDATLVATTTATLNGYLVSLNGYGDADLWFQYYWGAGTWTDHETAYDTVTTVGQYSKAVDTLPASTVIYFRIAADSTGGTTYGSGKNFTTGGPSAPQMLTNPASGVTRTSATLHGYVTDDGGATVTTWFEWGTSSEYGFETETAAGLFTGDSLYATLQGLSSSTTYYFRVLGDSTAGTGYGLGLNFTTGSPDSPSVTTLVAKDISATEATLQGQLVNDGGVPCDVRFEWGLDDSYGSTTGWQTGLTSGQVFQVVISSLNISETYHFRAVAYNPTDTDYGDDQSFETVFGPPSDFIVYSLGTNSISLKWEKEGDQTGIFMKAGSFPVDRLDGEQAYFGNAESCTISDLDTGTTYFFRAWSWMADGTWSDEYSEGAATTGTTIVPTPPDTPDVTGDFPDTPEEMYQDPSGSAFASWPFYPIIGDVATKIGMPSGSLWLIIAVVAVVVLGAIIFMISGSLLVVLVGIAVLLVFTGLMGLTPMWILVAYLVIGGSLAYFTKFA